VFQISVQSGGSMTLIPRGQHATSRNPFATRSQVTMQITPTDSIYPSTTDGGWGRLTPVNDYQRLPNLKGMQVLHVVHRRDFILELDDIYGVVRVPSGNPPEGIARLDNDGNRGLQHGRCGCRVRWCPCHLHDCAHQQCKRGACEEDVRHAASANRSNSEAVVLVHRYWSPHKM